LDSAGARQASVVVFCENSHKFEDSVTYKEILFFVTPFSLLIQKSVWEKTAASIVGVKEQWRITVSD
jgi:hypothetical protein